MVLFAKGTGKRPVLRALECTLQPGCQPLPAAQHLDSPGSQSGSPEPYCWPCFATQGLPAPCALARTRRGSACICPGSWEILVFPRHGCASPPWMTQFVLLGRRVPEALSSASSFPVKQATLMSHAVRRPCQFPSESMQGQSSFECSEVAPSLAALCTQCPARRELGIEGAPCSRFQA